MIYLISILVSAGGNDCVNFSAFSGSATFNV